MRMLSMLIREGVPLPTACWFPIELTHLSTIQELDSCIGECLTKEGESPKLKASLSMQI